MPRSPAYGIRARAAALGVLRDRGAAASALWLPPGYESSHYLWTATPGYVYSDTAGTVRLTGAGTARAWRAVNGTLAVSNAPVAWDGVSKFTHTGTQYWSALTGVARGAPETLVAVGSGGTSGAREAVAVANDNYYALLSRQSNAWDLFNGTDLILTQSDTAFVTTAVMNTTTSVIRVNGTENAGNTGTRTSTGLRIGGPPPAYFIGTLSAIYLAQYAADATRRAALEASFAQEFEVTL